MRSRWEFDDVIAGLALALDQLGSGETLTQRRLLALSTRNPAIPGPKVVTRAGKKKGLKLADMRALAAKRRASSG